MNEQSCSSDTAIRSFPSPLVSLLLGCNFWKVLFNKCLIMQCAVVQTTFLFAIDVAGFLGMVYVLSYLISIDLITVSCSF